MNNKATEIIKQYVQPDEVLLWAGQPTKGIAFEVADIFKTIYVLVFFIITYIIFRILSDISLLIAIPIAVIFFSFCLLMAVGRFIIDAHLRKKTYYGLTNKRIIIKDSMVNKDPNSVYLNTKLKIDFLPDWGSTSTIDIGIKEPSVGRGVSWIPNVKGYTSLYRLTDGDVVHRKIREILDSMRNTT